MKEEFEEYLARVYQASKVDSPFSLGGDIHIRFELGGELTNATKERVEQAVGRAEKIFHSTFPESDKQVYLIVYDYDGNSPFTKDKGYIYTLIEKEQFQGFYNEAAQINVGDLTDEDWVAGRIIVGRVKLADIGIKDILEGIANLEMGFEPAIPQQVYFFDVHSSKGFYMYDDRGCFVFSATSKEIKSVYDELNEWIVDYHRPEIDAFFK
ncbi:DUF3885 domain-containing protein [Pontibacter chinhatensis]|uniref:DUF3885 domain-containing protein n=1 Tax=Pontibacter chinhatensis TaxID=1436961 RepID=A0A1I2P258_9BACT|nr:DUF3885 domain-containing protein [Pontibacter chinhatensis]SFG10262.1 protein of unknown function [Pontibacter chinhatensis]